MSITDELRKWVKSLYTPNSAQVKDEALRIADRIDAEHESLLSDKEEELVLMDGSLDRLSGTIAELCSVLVVDVGTKRDEQIRSELVEAARNTIPLPKDADGETIHLQDRMMWDNGTFNVHELNLTADGWTTWDELHGYTVRADQCRHVQPDSWERIICDALSVDRDGRYAMSGSRRDELVERCKRLAGEGA